MVLHSGLCTQKTSLARRGKRQHFHILVPMDPEILPSRDEQLRVYRRSRSISGIETKAWISDGVRPNTWHANAITLAASLLGVDVMDVRRRVAEAALLQGKHLANPGVALTFVSEEFGWIRFGCARQQRVHTYVRS